MTTKIKTKNAATPKKKRVESAKAETETIVSAPIETNTSSKATVKSKTEKIPLRTLAFTKMSGAGNDFILIDNRQKKWSLSPEQITRICHRHSGIGADGVLLVEEGTKDVDYTMVYYNADGSLADMCGNGARCFARFVRSLKKSTRDRVTFATGAGIIEAEFPGEEVSINMTAPHSLQTSLSVPTSSGDWLVHSINTGVPHVVCFVNDVELIDVRQLGYEMRFHSLFAPKGTNVNFVQITGPDSIMVRTYERGVEGETLACGTGVVASAILAYVVGGVGKPMKVAVRSGVELTVDLEHQEGIFSQTRLQGPATTTFTGEIELA